MAEQSKGNPEVWAAGIGRKSQAQYGSDLMVEVLRELGLDRAAIAELRRLGVVSN